MQKGDETALVTESTWTEGGLWSWRQAQYQFSNATQMLMQPWEGYWLWVNESGVVLSVPPMTTMLASPAKALAPLLWSVEVRLLDASQIDSANRLGVAVGANAGWDTWDRMKPPYPDRRTHLSLVQGERHLMQDIRPDRSEEWLWQLHINAQVDLQSPSQQQPVSGQQPLLQWETDGLPMGYYAYLEDRSRGIRTQLQKGMSGYPVAVEDARFQLRVSPQRLPFELEGVVPTQSELMPPYPNPANPELWIPYLISGAGDVRLRIFDIQGKQVRQLALGHQQAGAYASKGRAAHWDGRNDQGEDVASGLYILQLQTPTFQAEQKLMIRR